MNKGRQFKHGTEESNMVAAILVDYLSTDI